jgi:hypothetical protein
VNGNGSFDAEPLLGLRVACGGFTLGSASAVLVDDAGGILGLEVGRLVATQVSPSGESG